MYMFPGEMMALFNDGATDCGGGHLFSPVEFMQQQQQQQPSSHHQNDRQGVGDGASGPAFLKMNGMVNSS